MDTATSRPGSSNQGEDNSVMAKRLKADMKVHLGRVDGQRLNINLRSTGRTHIFYPFLFCIIIHFSEL